MDDFKKNFQLEKRNYINTGSRICHTIYVNKSKPIIDQIDCLLAEHYGFTDEELDFIINYDIKYRMGREAGEDGD
jgi:hypothetical protein